MKRNGWRTSAKQPVKNADLWGELDAVNAHHKIHWHWVKGHAGHTVNELCDEFANEAIAAVKASHTPQQLAALLEEFKTETATQS